MTDFVYDLCRGCNWMYRRRSETTPQAICPCCDGPTDTGVSDSSVLEYITNKVNQSRLRNNPTTVVP